MVTLDVTGLSKQFDGRAVLEGVNLRVAAGEALVVRGGNGTGKTTLLRCLVGSERSGSGEVRLDGVIQRTSSHRYWRRVYGVLDDFSWFPDLTVGDHLRLLDPRTDPIEALARFEVEHVRDRIAVSLSSGQMRRVALATTLVRRWDVLLLDEPEQRLDEDGLHRLVTVLHELQRDGRTVILSTHSIYLQERVASQVLTLDPV